MLPAEDSNHVSGFAVTYLKPFLDPFDAWEDDAFHYFIRKLGHFVEYGLLGLFFGSFIHLLCGIKGNRSWYLLLLAIPVIAACDEFLQSFTGRNSSVADVFLDVLGAMTGCLLAVLLAYISYRRRMKNETGLQ